MASQTPLVILRNVFDTIWQYPTATLSASSEQTGREARRVASYRRDRQWWSPSSVEPNHLSVAMNTAGAAGRRCTGAAASFTRANTSHMVGFYFRSAQVPAGAGAIQSLLYFAGSSGANTMAFHRDGGNGRLGFYDGTFRDLGAGAVAPSDDAWHTLIFVLDAAGGTGKVYVDGVQVGTAGGATYAPKGIDTTGGWTLLSGLASQAAVGRLARAVYYANTPGTAGTPTVAALHAALAAPGGAPSATNLVADWNASLGLRGQTLTDAVGAVNPVLGTTAAEEPTLDPVWDGGAALQVDLGLGQSAAPDALFLDRGHNWPGGYLVVEGSDDGVFWNDGQLLQVNASGTTGGAPVTGSRGAGTLCGTEEGAGYALFTAPAARQHWRLRFPALASGGAYTLPAIPGVILGARIQFLGYLDVFDEDAGARKGRTEESDAGWVAAAPTYSWRTAELRLRLIGAPEYDGSMRTIRALMFERDCPGVLVKDFGSYPERGWMFKYDGNAWGMPKQKTYRSGTHKLREHYPRTTR